MESNFSKKKKIEMNLSTKQKTTSKHRKQTYSSQNVNIGGMKRELVMNTHTTICKIDIQYSSGTVNSAQYSVIAYVRKESKKKNKYRHMCN